MEVCSEHMRQRRGLLGEGVQRVSGEGGGGELVMRRNTFFYNSDN